MIYIPNIKSIWSFSIFYNYDWFIKSKPHSKFKHHIWISRTNITNDDIIGIYISYNIIVYYIHLIRLTNHFNVEICFY